ncbi:ribonuclease domain-containing protein [Amycolatopsis nigrescens]|uniref:ribonuclease domain-containing protein n=1 Tax=Amycolatopsis nigrescens TaxID=381445 RepID=UPI000381FC51|nr:ribonuclease domain-containing protein [Amycolatopsis nigrescens]
MVNKRRIRITVALIGLIVLVLGGWLIQQANTGDGGPAPAGSPTASGTGTAVVAGMDSGLPVKGLSSLPPEAADTWKLIKSNGPFPFQGKDGSVFGNRERQLPQKKQDYYQEYTVKTPGSADRGARRLVTGQADELYYTGDHYASFVVVDPKR